MGEDGTDFETNCTKIETAGKGDCWWHLVGNLMALSQDYHIGDLGAISFWEIYHQNCVTVVSHERTATGTDLVTLITFRQVIQNWSFNKDFFGDAGRVCRGVRDYRDWGCGRSREGVLEVSVGWGQKHKIVCKVVTSNLRYWIPFQPWLWLDILSMEITSSSSNKTCSSLRLASSLYCVIISAMV